MPFSIQPPVIAHRGASAYAPENTLASFLKAKQLGANWVEFDVMLTADHEVVVIHDEELDRTTNGMGRVSDCSYADIKKLDAGSWFDPVFSAEKILSLREMADFLRQHQMAANVEIKALPGHEEMTAIKVLEIIQQCWTKDMTPPLISSFSLPVLHIVRQYSAASHLGLLMHHWLPEWQQLCDKLQCAAVDVNEKIIDPDKVKQIKATQRLVLAYTVNDSQRAQELFSWGVDAVFTDCPDQILAHIS